MRAVGDAAGQANAPERSAQASLALEAKAAATSQFFSPELQGEAVHTGNHCFGCTAELEIAKFEAAADKFGMALLAPQGIGHSFNAPHCCGPARDRRLDDVGFIDRLIDVMADRYNVDMDRIYAVGFSNGAALSNAAGTGTLSGNFANAGMTTISSRVGSTRRSTVMSANCAGTTSS